MPRSSSPSVGSVPVRPEQPPGKGELAVSLNRIGEPYTPRTTSEKQAWGSLVKQGLGGLLGIAERVGATTKEVDEVVEMLGLREMYAMSLGEGVR